MTETAQPNTPAANEAAAEPVEDVQPDAQDAPEPEAPVAGPQQPQDGQDGDGLALVPVVLNRTLAGYGDTGDPVLVSAELAAVWHDAEYADYLDNAAAHALGLEGEWAEPPAEPFDDTNAEPAPEPEQPDE